MFSRSKNKYKFEEYTSVSDGMRRLYSEKLLPLELSYKFHELVSPKLEDSDFDAKPMIMFVGQYSTGKTTLVKYLLNQEYPGSRIGPEPTTDGFNVVMLGDNERVIPGNALVVDSKKPFKAFSKFGNNFLNKFVCSEMPNKLLESITFIDTPGILSGEKQSIMRGYDFAGVVRAFAERVDMIVLIFDAHKLDISDEFKSVIDCFKDFGSKIRVILNKSDNVTSQQLLRVYGALMWSLGKIFVTPEVCRVFVGSFWDKPLQNDSFKELFELEENDLLDDVKKLPATTAMRKLNDLIRRARLAKIVSFIVSEISASMPVFGKDKKKAYILDNLGEIYQKLHINLQLSLGDFPKTSELREKLKYQDFSKFPPVKPKLISAVDCLLETDLSRLVDMVQTSSKVSTQEEQFARGGVFSSVDERQTETINPFSISAGTGIHNGHDYDGWIVDTVRDKFDEAFYMCGPTAGKLRGDVVRAEAQKSKLPNILLSKIWKLSDVDKDGLLDKDEWALFFYLINLKLSGHEIPQILPEHLIPPSKRNSN